MEGIKRIKEMSEGQKDFVLLEVVEYLTSREDMNQKYLNKEKTLKGMALYIQGQIIKDFCKKMNTKDPESLAQVVKYDNKSTKCLAIGMSKEKTFELAINYFDKTNEELGIKAEEINKKETIKKEEKFGPIFGITSVASTEKKKSKEIEQISLFTI